jgi:hydrogenase maturation protease
MSAPGDGRVLVAGIGNVFLGDDGFGVEVVNRIDPRALPDVVDVADYGIRGVHLAYELLEGRHATLVMVDAVPTGDAPGTLCVLEVGQGRSQGHGQAQDRVDRAGEPGGVFEAPVVDAHGLHPQAVLDVLHGLGGGVERVLVVGCQPDSVAERMGLSDPVAGAVDEAVRLVVRVAREEAARLGSRNEVRAG